MYKYGEYNCRDLYHHVPGFVIVIFCYYSLITLNVHYILCFVLKNTWSNVSKIGEFLVALL